MRVCLEPGCAQLQDAPRCPAHQRRREQARGSASARGYDRKHRAIRGVYQSRMQDGERFTCWRCGGPIDPANWTLGHCDADRSRYHGPECPPCDYATSGRDGAACPHPSHAGISPGA